MSEREKLQQAQEIQRELNDKGLSRRAFLDRLKVLGVGFGAAAMLGVRDADADVRSDASLSLKSTNPALNNIIEEGRQDLLGDGPNSQMAYSRGYIVGVIVGTTLGIVGATPGTLGTVGITPGTLGTVGTMPGMPDMPGTLATVGIMPGTLVTDKSSEVAAV